MHILLKIILYSFFYFVTLESRAAPWHFTPQDVNGLHSQSANYKIFYGKDSLQFGELRLPNGRGPFPVAIVIHGGCWLSGFADLQNTAALSDALRDMGIATWNIEYRRVDNKGGGWPGTFLDVASATDFLREIAKKYSLDLKRVIVIGHSAGGHLALWLSMRDRLPAFSDLYVYQPLPLRGVISMGGVPDLKAFRSHGEKVCGSDVVAKLLGESPEQINNRYLHASPSELLPSHVSQILIYGEEDQAVPAAFGQAYVKKAQKKGEVIPLVQIEGAAHHEYNVPNSVTWSAIRIAVKKLLF